MKYIIYFLIFTTFLGVILSFYAEAEWTGSNKAKAWTIENASLTFTKEQLDSHNRFMRMTACEDIVQKLRPKIDYIIAHKSCSQWAFSKNDNSWDFQIIKKEICLKKILNKECKE